MKIAALALGDGSGQFAQRLAHHPRLQPDMGITDFSIEFRLGHQGRDRIDDDQVDSV